MDLQRPFINLLKRPYWFAVCLALILFSNSQVYGQACSASTPSYTANLTGDPDSVWTSPLPEVSRAGLCCGASNPDRCIEFWVTLDPGAEGINFSIATGAIPSGSMFYQVFCGPPVAVGTNLCLSGVGPHRITFCKPGGNENRYRITSIAKPSVTETSVVSDACTSTISTSGYVTASITWQSIAPGAPGQYNNYLSCTSGCATTTATYQPGAPAFVDYQVCGTPTGGCSGVSVCNTTRVFFVSTLAVTINPNNPTICFGGSSTPLTAAPTGGSGNYSYAWNTGATTQVINANAAGTYSVVVTDLTSCPTASASRIVTVYNSPILANAGPDVASCANNSSAVLSGSVQQATGGIWTGGAGVYSPSNTSLTPTYTPTALEISNGTVTHTLTTTGNGTCPSHADQTTQTIALAPIVNAGADRTVCGNNASLTLAGTVTNAGGGRWSGGTGTFFPNDSTLNAIYTPSAAEIAALTVNLTLTSIQNGGCTPVSDQMRITIDPAPTAAAGIDRTVCANNPSVTLAGTVTNATGFSWSGGTGSFNPNNTTLNAVYTPSAAEIAAQTVTLTLTSTKLNCNPATDQMTITITPAPTVNAGPDVNVCGNNSTVTLNGIITVATGGIWTSNGTGTFNPNNTTLNASYVPSSADTAAGFVNLTLTTTGFGNCNAVADVMRINYSDAPSAFAGADRTVCANNPSLVLNGSVRIATGGTWSGGGSFSPNATTLNATYTPSAAEITAKTATLTLTTSGNGTCNAVTDQMVITITDAPTVSAGIDRTVCANNSTVVLNGTRTIATGATWTTNGTGTFSNATALNSNYVPSTADTAAGSVTLTLTTTGNGTCNAVADQMVITYTDAPTANAGIDRTVCRNNPAVVLNGQVSVATGGAWTGGLGTFNPNRNTLNATYTPTGAELTSGVTLTLTTTGFGTCTAVADAMTITVTAPPTVNAGPDQASCANNPSITMAGSVTVATGGTWSLGCGTFAPDANTLNAIYTPCITEINNGVASLVLTTTGNGNCLAVTDTMTLIISPAPIADAGPDQAVCANNPNITLAGSILNATTFTWSGTGTFNPGTTTDLNPVYTPTLAEINAGTVTISLRASEPGCIDVTDQVTIAITPAPVVSAGPDVTVCGNNSTVPLTGSVTIGGVASTGAWTSTGTGAFLPNANTLNASYVPSSADTAAGTVTLTLRSTTNGTCIQVTDQMVITITDAPFVNAGPNQTVCANRATINLNGYIRISTGGTWTTTGSGTFNPNNTTLNATYTPSAADTTAGSVTLTLATTGNGICAAVSDPMLLTITRAPVVNAGPDQAICANNAVATLAGSITVATGGVWTGGAGIFNPNNTTYGATYTPTATEITNGTVTLTLTSTGNGTCNQVADNVTITITTAPTVNAGPDQAVCGNATTVALAGAITIATGATWTTTGTGTFSPNATTLNASYVPSTADTTAGTVTLRLTTTGNGNCIPVNDQMIITFSDVPFANAGPDRIVCTNDLPIQLNGTATSSSWVGGNGTFSPSRNVLNPVYTPSAGEIAAQTVTLTLSTIVNGSCPAATDNITISIPPGPIVSAGVDRTICGDVTNIALAGTVTNAAGGQWTTTGTGLFTPNAATLNATYTPSAADIAGGGVTLTLTSTGNGSCSPVVDQMTLTITPAPTINAGPNITVCGDIGSINLNAVVTVATGGTWVTSGTGTFNNSAILNPVYTFTSADTASHSVTLTVTSTGNGTCNAVVDQVVVTITPAPIVSAGPDQTICADLASTPLNATFAVATGGVWSSSGTGTFSPNVNTPNASYFPSNADTAANVVTLTFTTTGNGTCNAVFDQMILNINPQPVVNAGPDQVACADIALVNLNGIVNNAGGGIWTSSGTGTFAPNNTTLNATYDPSVADTTGGVVILTLTSSANGTCNAVADQMVINFTPAPIVNAGLNQTICADGRTVSLNASVFVATGVTWTSSGSGTFNDPNILNPTYTASDADTAALSVTLTATTTGNGTCNAVNDNMVVTISRVPVVSAGPDQTRCGDVVGISLAGSVVNATGGVWSGGAGTFSPNANTLNATYTPSAAERTGTSVILTLTSTGNGTCNPVADQVTITITTPPTALAGPDQTVCADIAAVNLTGSVTIASGGSWTSSGTGVFGNATNLITTYTPSAADTANKIVVVTLTTTGNGTCNAVTDQMTINITPAPKINAGPDRSICADQRSLVLNGTVTVSTGATWTTLGSGTFSPNANTLNANYLTSDADTTSQFVRLVITSTGNGTCNAVTDTMNITIRPVPVVNAGVDVTVCADVNSIILNGATMANATGGAWTSTGTGSFSPNAFTINPTYILSANDKAAGNVQLTLTSSGSGTCTARSDQMTITITPAPTVNAGLDQTVCATTAGVTLNGAVTVATGGSWATASGAGTFSPNNTTLNATFIPAPSQIAAGLAILRLTTTGNGTCNAVTDEMRIIITPAPVVDGGPNQTLCANITSVTLAGSVTNATGGSWVTSGTGTFSNVNILNPSYTPSAADKIAGNITLTLTSTGSGVCSAVSDNVTLGFSPVPAVDAGPSSLCTNASGIGLSGTVTNAGGGRWTTSSGTGTFTPSQNILTPHYTPSVADQGVGSVKLYFTTTGNGPCPAAVDSIQVGIQPNPSANAGPDMIVCADIGNVSLNGSVANAGGGIWTSTGGGPFGPSATTLNASYTLSAVDIANGTTTLTLTTTGNGFCAAASDQMTITITPAPTVTAGPDVTACSDIAGIPLTGAVTVSTGGNWTSSGTGTFNPNSTTLNATYVPSAADTAAGSVTLTLTTTGNGTCNAIFDQKVITLTPAPTVFAGFDRTICGDVSAVAFTAFVNVATGVTWTRSGTGSFDNANTLTTQYTLSAADTAAGLVTLVATTTGNGTCNAVRDTVLLIITPAPTVIASAANACADTDTIQLSGVVTVATGGVWTKLPSAGGSFFPDATTLNARYVRAVTDVGVIQIVLTTTGSGSCNEVSDTVSLNIVPAPVANAGPDQTICSNVDANLNGSVSFAGGGVWSTLGSGTFPLGPTVLNGIYEPSSADTAAGAVTLVLTTTGTGTCNPVTDTMRIFFTPAPFVDAGPAVICQSAGAVNLNGIIFNAGGPSVWSGGNGAFGNINDLSTTYTPVPADAPSVVITLTIPGMGTCANASDNITINITSAPTANAGADQIRCADIALVPLSGILTNAGGSTWSTSNGTGTFADANALVTTYDPTSADTAAGSVAIILTTTNNGVCLPVTDTLIVTFTDAPTINAGPASVCANAPPVALNGSASVATSFVWTTNGDGSFGNANNLVTTYNPGAGDLTAPSVTLTLTSTAQGTCNPVSDAITLFIEPPPSASANINQTICADSAGVDLSGSVSGATGGLWTSSGSGTFSPDATTLTATYIPSNADTTARTVTLTLTTTGVAPCNPVSDDMIITINPVPVVRAGADRTVCGDVASISLNGVVINATGGLWSTPNGTGGFANANNLNTTYTPTQADTTAGTVTFVLTSTGMGFCNPVTDTMVVTISNAPTVTANPTQLCTDAVSVPIRSVITTATGGLWTTNGTGSFAPNNISLNTNYIPSAADRGVGSVILTITTTGNGTCNPVSDIITIFLTPAPTATAGADQGVCADAVTVTLTGSVTNAPGGQWTTLGSGSFANDLALNTTYTMSDADTTARIVRLVLTTTGVAPCVPATDTVVINITPAPVAIVNAGSDTTVCESNPDIPLKGTIANAGGGMWTTPNGTGIFTPNAFTLNATYLPSGGDVLAGSVELILESTGNGMCNPVTDTMIVTITRRPTANAGPDDTICADVVSIPLNGILTTATQGLWITTGSGSFNPDANTLNASYIPSVQDTADGTVILTLQTIDNGACSAAFDNREITITPAPTADAGFDQIVCGDAGSVSLNGIVTIATGGAWTTSGTGTFDDDSIVNPVYTFSSADTAAGSVTLTLTTTGNGTCIPVPDNVVITITNAPIINAGPDQTICADEPSISLSGFITVASGGQWTSDGTGIYSPDDVTLATSYFTTSADTAAGALTFVLTSTGNGGCNTVRDTVEVTIQPAPIIDAGPDQTVCADIGNVSLNGVAFNAAGGDWTSSGTGTFPDATILNATYVPSAIDTANGFVILNLISNGNGVCNPDVDNMMITINPAPIVNAGPDQTVCADLTSVALNGTVITASGGVWTTSGTGSFSPDSATLNASYIPSPADSVAGVIYLKLTSTGNGTCNPVSDSLRLTITPKPTITITNPNPLFICADANSVAVNATITVASGAAWTTSGTGGFAPNANTVNINYIPSAADKAAGIVGLQITTTGNGTCNAATDDIILRITPAPTVDAGPDQVICADVDFINLAGSATVAGGAVWTSSGSGAFVPNAGNFITAYNPSSADSTAGVVIFTITTTSNGTCNPVTDDVRVTFTTAPTINAGPDQGVCADLASVNLNGVVSVASSGVWTTRGSGTFSPDGNGLNRNYILSAADTTAGSVTLVVTSTGNGTCRPVRDSLVINIAPTPVVISGGPNICADLNSVPLDGRVYNALGGLWSSNGSGSFAPNNATLIGEYIPSAADIAAGQVTLTLTSDGNGTCNAVSSPLFVTITPLPVANAGIDQLICRGSSTFIIAQSVPDVTYQWSTTSGTVIQNTGIASVTANSDTSFVLQVTDARNCSIYDTIDIAVVDPPTFNLASSYCFAFGTPMDANPIPVPVVGGFQWFRNDSLLFGENNSTILIDQVATYMISYNYGSCTVFDTTDVTPLPVLNGPDRFVCLGNATIVNTDAIPGATYNWLENGIAFPGNNDSINVVGSVTPYDSSTYVVTVTDVLGCQNNDTMFVIPVPPPTINISNIPSCEGETVTLNASVNPIIGWQYAWFRNGANMNLNTPSINVTTSGSYIVEYSLDECSTTDTSLVTFFALPVPSNETEVKYCNESAITATLDAGPSFRYQWLNTPNPAIDTLQNVIVDDPGLYYVRLTNVNNCFVVDSINVRDVCPPRLFVAESFIPDGSNSGNSRFFIKGAYFHNFSITIFNRWGEIIFYSEDPSDEAAWDGSYRGEPMPIGVYPYIIKYEGVSEDDRGPFRVEGSVVIIR